VRRYGQHDVGSAEVIVALGGDGWMLDTLHDRYADRLPVYGMHRGTVGFLMNEYSEDDLPARLDAAVRAVIHPLEMKAVRVGGATSTMLAINEVSLLRQTRQTAKLRIAIDGKVRLEELACDRDSEEQGGEEKPALDASFGELGRQSRAGDEQAQAQHQQASGHRGSRSGLDRRCRVTAVGSPRRTAP